MDVLGAGALNLDLVYEIPDLSVLSRLGIHIRPGEEQTVDHGSICGLLEFLDRNGEKVSESGGGSAANTVCVLAAFGVSAGYVGTVGRDPEGDRVLASMKGVDCSLVARQGRTAVCVVLIERGARDRAMLVASDPGGAPRASPGLSGAVSSARILHLSSMVHDQGLGFQEGLVQCLGEGQILSLDPGEIYARKGLSALSGLLSRTDVLFVTGREVEMLTGRPVARGLEVLHGCLCPGARRRLPFQDTGGAVILCKQGRDGAVLYSPWLKKRVFARKVARVVDNTGAGDAFDAGFILGLLKGEGVSRCLERAAGTAALALSDYGRAWLGRVATGSFS